MDIILNQSLEMLGRSLILGIPIFNQILGLSIHHTEIHVPA